MRRGGGLIRGSDQPLIAHTAYKRFRHPNIIRCLDSVVTQSREDDGKIIYVRRRLGWVGQSALRGHPLLCFGRLSWVCFFAMDTDANDCYLRRSSSCLTTKMERKSGAFCFCLSHADTNNRADQRYVSRGRPAVSSTSSPPTPSTGPATRNNKCSPSFTAPVSPSAPCTSTANRDPPPRPSEQAPPHRTRNDDGTRDHPRCGRGRRTRLRVRSMATAAAAALRPRLGTSTFSLTVTSLMRMMMMTRTRRTSRAG